MRDRERERETGWKSLVLARGIAEFCGTVRASRVFQTLDALESLRARTNFVSHNSTCNARNLGRAGGRALALVRSLAPSLARAKTYKFAETVENREREVDETEPA